MKPIVIALMLYSGSTVKEMPRDVKLEVAAEAALQGRTPVLLGEMRGVPFPNQEYDEAGQAILPNQDLLSVWVKLDVETEADGTRKARAQVKGMDVRPFDAEGKAWPQGHPTLDEDDDSGWRYCHNESDEVCAAAALHALGGRVGDGIRRMTRWIEAVRSAEKISEKLPDDPASIVDSAELKAALQELNEAHKDLYKGDKR